MLVAAAVVSDIATMDSGYRLETEPATGIIMHILTNG